MTELQQIGQVLKAIHQVRLQLEEILEAIHQITQLQLGKSSMKGKAGRARAFNSTVHVDSSQHKAGRARAFNSTVHVDSSQHIQLKQQ